MDDKIIRTINQYLDGELNKKSEVALFTLLSEKEEARKYFKSLNMMESIVQATSEEFPSELEERILRSLEEPNELKFSFFRRAGLSPILSYAFALLMVIISIYFYLKLESYQDRMKSISNYVIQQSHTIEVLYNSLPVVEVKGKLNNQIIIKSNL